MGVETRPARPQHLIDQFCKSLIKHHVLASPQSHRATVSPHGVPGWNQEKCKNVAEQHGGGFVWRAGVGYQYQGGKGGSEQQKGKDRRSIEREGRFTQGLGWEHFYTSNGPSS